jgi:hypothetical protein
MPAAEAIPSMGSPLIETELLWSGDLDDSVDGLTNGCAGNRAGDRVSCDGLDERVRKANRVAVGCGVGNVLDELEETGSHARSNRECRIP